VRLKATQAEVELHRREIMVGVEQDVIMLNAECANDQVRDFSNGYPQ
jgi:hypothetical protein